MSGLALVLWLSVNSAWSADENKPDRKESDCKIAVDIAAFARKMTWDPRQNEIGIGRAQEFPAEYIFPGRELKTDSRGLYNVPLWKDHQGCIGLQWLERRDLKKLELHFADAEQMPAVHEIKVEFWYAASEQESIWQGKWIPLEVTAEKSAADRLVFHVDFETKKDVPATLGRRFAPILGVMKVRFIFAACDKPIRLKDIFAYSQSAWQTTKITIEQENSWQNNMAEIEIYNGTILSAEDSPSKCKWDMGEKLEMELCCSRPQQHKSDRTILWFRLPESAFGVTIEDVLNNGHVYIPSSGVFISRASDNNSSADYRAKIEGHKTVLEKVHEMPDQRLAQAMKVHNFTLHNFSPTLLSLACHNRKSHVRRSGIINYSTFDYLNRGRMPKDFLVPQFGAHKDEDAARFLKATSFSRSLAYPWKPSPQQSERDKNKVRRYLHGDWMPIQVLEIKEGGLVYGQHAFVAPWNKGPTPSKAGWANQQAVCVSAFTIENPQAQSADAELTLRFISFRDQDKKAPRIRADIRPVSGGAIVMKDGKLAAFVNTSDCKRLNLEISGDNVILRGAIPAQGRVACAVYIPGWEVNGDGYAQFRRSPQMLLNDTEAYWNDVTADTTRIDIPDELFEKIIKASVMYLLAATRQPQPDHLAPWAAAWVYGPIENEAQVVIRAMDLMNHKEFSRRSLDYYLSRYDDAGALTTGYTLMGTGWNLWTIAEHYKLTGNRDWFDKNIKQIIKACNWITAQCEKTKAFDVYGNKVPEYGLFPPGVTGDWPKFGYRFYLEAHNYNGLNHISQILADLGYPQGNAFKTEAAEFRHNIVRAYEWSRARSPVVAMSNGTWVPNYPAIVYCYGRVSDMHPSGNRAAESYDVEHGSQHLAAFSILDPSSRDVDWMLDHLEDVCFLMNGMRNCYGKADDRRDWFNRGGFSQYYPPHSRIVEIHALRDDVKAVIRSNFNQIPASLDTENLSFWEHPCTVAAWNKLHATGRIVAQTRLMFVMEKGNQLWLAPFVPNHYLKDGRRVSVMNAPTHFGHTNYVITSSVNKGFIEATIDPPTRHAPDEIILRVRHPEGRLMRSVLVNDEPHADFNPEKEYVRLKSSETAIKVRAEFAPPQK